MKDLKTQLTQDLAVTTRKLDRAREKAESANTRVTELERQQAALQSALDIMEGRSNPSTISLPMGYTLLPYSPAPLLRDEPATWQPTAGAEPAGMVDFNRDKILLEKGFRVGKNSFGEDVLLPENMPDPEPMSEPTRPTAPPSILPPIGQDEGFASEMPTAGEEIPF